MGNKNIYQRLQVVLQFLPADMFTAASLAAGHGRHSGRPHALLKRMSRWNKARCALNHRAGPPTDSGRFTENCNQQNSNQQTYIAHKLHVVISIAINRREVMLLTFDGLFYVFIIAVHAAGGCWPHHSADCCSCHPWGVMSRAWCDNRVQMWNNHIWTLCRQIIAHTWIGTYFNWAWIYLIC